MKINNPFEQFGKELYTTPKGVRPSAICVTPEQFDYARKACGKLPELVEALENLLLQTHKNHSLEVHACRGCAYCEALAKLREVS